MLMREPGIFMEESGWQRVLNDLSYFSEAVPLITDASCLKKDEAKWGSRYVDIKGAPVVAYALVLRRTSGTWGHWKPASMSTAFCLPSSSRQNVRPLTPRMVILYR